MYVILVIAVAWLILVALALAILRSAALADRAAERQRRVARAALILAAVPIAAAGAPDADAQGCANAHSLPGRAAPQATLCLINVERRARHFAPLSANRRLARAARLHAADMVARRYFSHVAPSGGTVFARLQRVGYPGGCPWKAGETLAWGFGGGQATPAARVSGWMRSRPHRRLLLSRGFREAGVGIAAGAPNGSRAGFTYAVELGRRRC